MWLDELGKESVSVAGGKGANLGELTRAGFSVPPGFVVTAPAYLQAMEEAGVRADLRDGAARFEPGAGGEAAAAELQELVHKAGIPETLGHAIIDAYNRLGDNLFVAVRSSATAEDTASTSFAGMNETFTNVRGADELLDRVVDCWASLFGARVCTYRAHASDRGRARDRRRGPANGRRPPIGRDVHRRPGHRRSHDEW